MWTLVGNEIVDHSDVVGVSPVGAAPTTALFSTQHLPSIEGKGNCKSRRETFKFWTWELGAAYTRNLTVLVICRPCKYYWDLIIEGIWKWANMIKLYYVLMLIVPLLNVSCYMFHFWNWRRPNKADSNSFSEKIRASDLEHVLSGISLVCAPLNV